MHTHAPLRPVSSVVERLLDKQEVAGPNPARDTGMRFYGYKHWTLEEPARCFYVGKGLRKRPYDNRRSAKWHAIIKRLGLRVEICVGPITNESACSWEVENILKERTFSHDFRHNTDDIGCNFTLGGDGVAGKYVSSDARKRIGDAQRGKPKSQETKQKIREALQGKKLSDVTRQRMSEAKKGRPLSIENRQSLWSNRSRQFSDAHRQSLSLSRKGQKASDETRQKMSESLKGRKHKCSICHVTGHTKPTCPMFKEKSCLIPSKLSSCEPT